MSESFTLSQAFSVLLTVAGVLVGGFGWRWLDRMQKELDELDKGLDQLRLDVAKMPDSNGIKDMRKELRDEVLALSRKVDQILNSIKGSQHD